MPPKRRRRGRPLSFDREAALARVTPVLWTKGFAGASLDELAAAAGLNRPNLASAFGDKRGLYLAALELYRTNFAKRATSAVQQADGLRSALSAFFNTAIDIYTADGLGCFIFGTAPAASAEDEDVKLFLAASLEWVERAFEERIASDGPASGGRTSKAIALALTGILLNLAMQARSGRSKEDLTSISETAIDAVL